MPMIPCLDCGRLTDRQAARRQGRNKRAWGRCPWCATTKPYIDTTETKRRKAAVDAWVAQHGYTCPGWHTPPHPATDLTADHSIAVAAGGNESGQLAVLCRRCNSAKGSATH